jgi:type II secretory pathway pseudopilin PulG
MVVAPAPVRPGRPARSRGYMIIMLMFLLSVMALGLTVAYPVWKTQIQREREDELIFRGRQYVEAIRLFQAKNPGRFPKSFRDLVEKKFLRRLYPDPMTADGEWNIILQSGQPRQRNAGGAPQEVLVGPPAAVAAINNPSIIGVVSSSTAKSVKIYNDKDSYDQWLFYLGQDPKRTPTIIYLKAKGREDP